MRVAIHQPECFPWLGFWHKMDQVDVFVLLDTVQFEKNGFQNRNKILIAGEPKWLTLPLSDHFLGQKVGEVKINWNDKNFVKKHLNTLKQSYGKHPYFDGVWLFLENLYKQKPARLADFNEKFIRFMAEELGIKTKIIKASELDLSGEAKGGTEVTLEICKLLKADEYLSGIGAKAYLEVVQYKKNNVNVVWQEFEHPYYEQLGRRGDFVSHLSVLDLFLNLGPKSLEIIRGDNKK